MFDNKQNHNPTGKGGENPNPGEDAAHKGTRPEVQDVMLPAATVPHPTKEYGDEVGDGWEAYWAENNPNPQLVEAEIDAAFAAYVAKSSGDAAREEGAVLADTFIEVERFYQEEEAANKDAEEAFSAAVVANLRAKGKRAERRIKSKKAAAEQTHILKEGFLPLSCQRRELDGLFKGALPSDKQKRVCWYTNGRRKVVKLTPKGEPYKLNSKRTRKWDSSKKPVWRPRSCYMLEPPEEPINAD